MKQNAGMDSCADLVSKGLFNFSKSSRKKINKQPHKQQKRKTKIEEVTNRNKIKFQ